MLELPPWDRPQPKRSPVWQGRINALLSQEELATKVSVSRQTIWSIERGHSLPTVTLALALARALDTTVEALWGD